MQRLKRVFADRGGLHRRIDMLLNNSSVPRIGIIPLGCPRGQITGVLNALVADPLGDSAWMPSLRERTLAKDALITQAPAFDYIETRNSVVEYPVPIPGPPIEYLEAVSEDGSAEHLAACHLLLYVTTGTVKVAPRTEYPHVVIHVEDHIPSSSEHLELRFEGETLPLSLKAAEEANDILRQSPANISSYMALIKSSGVADLRAQVTDTKKVRAALRQSILATCETMIPSRSTAIDAHVVWARQLRADWAAYAHHELQASYLPTLAATLNNSLAWYKLYARTDDVEPLLQTVLADHLMPESRARLAYVVGQLQSNPSRDKSVEPWQGPWLIARHATEAAAASLNNQALWAVLGVATGIQLPLIALSVAGTYFIGLSIYSMGAVAALGIIVGLRRLQTLWLRACDQFMERAEILVQEAIRESEGLIWDTSEAQIMRDTDRRTEMVAALAEAAVEDPTLTSRPTAPKQGSSASESAPVM